MEPDNSTKRPTREMTAVLGRMHGLLGPLDRWSDDALAELESRLLHLRQGIEREWIRRDELEVD